MIWHVQALVADPWFLGALLLGCGMLALQWYRKDKPLFFLLRSASLALMLWAIAQPELVRSDPHARPPLAIAVDVSASMHVAQRLQDVEKQLERLLPGVREQWDPVYYTFSGSSQKVRDLRQVHASIPGESTNIAGSLAEIERDVPNGLAGILLFSDGNTTAGLHDGELQPAGHTPVIACAPASAVSLVDTSIQSVRVPDFAFKGVPLELKVHYGAAGCQGRTTSVSVYQGDTRIAQRSVVVAGNAESGEISLMVTPGTNGTQKYRVQITAVSGEISEANNTRTVSVDVLRDKVRVLYICGRPSFEYSFMRHVLKNDPLIDLVSFVILRNPENTPLVSEQDLALIPFPVRQLFTKDLSSFDVVVFENFSYQRFDFMPEYLENIARFVQDQGGSFMMIGGENSFGAGGWRGTAVDPILPAMDEAEGGGWQDGLVRARPVQREHPILQVSDDLARSAAVVRQLPELDGCTRLVARNGSQVLLASPVGGWPLLTVWDRGKGRVAAVGMNTTWRWALQMPTAEAYTALWRNMFRWLSKTADQGAWQLKFDRDSAAVGQAYQLKVRAPAGTLAPQARVWLRDPAGNRTALPLERMGSAEWAAHGFVSQPGVYQASLDASSARGAAHHTAVLRVDAASVRESLALTINEPALQGIATARAGGYFKSNAVQVTDIQRIARAVTAPAQAEQVALWDHVMFMLLIVLLLVAEWYIRRRN